MATYTPDQLVRALVRVKKVALPAQVANVRVSSGHDGKCLVHIVEDKREEALGFSVTVALTIEETRAWRAECQRIALEDGIRS